MGDARAAGRPVRVFTSSLLNTWVRWPSTVRAVTNRVWAISRLVSPCGGEFGDAALAGGERFEPCELHPDAAWLRWRAARSRPVGPALRRRRGGRGRGLGGAARGPRRGGCRDGGGRRGRRGRGPVRAGCRVPPSASIASRSSSRPRSPPATSPAARSATPRVRGAPKARANSSSSSLEASGRVGVAEGQGGQRGVGTPRQVARA